MATVTIGSEFGALPKKSVTVSIVSPSIWHEVINRTFLVAQTVKCLPTMQETWVQSLGWEELLEKEMATYSSILVWKIPWIREPSRLQSRGSQRVRQDWATSLQIIAREHSSTHQQKIGLKIYWAWPRLSEQDLFPLSQCLPSRSFHKPLILLHQKADRLKTTITEN